MSARPANQNPEVRRLELDRREFLPAGRAPRSDELQWRHDWHDASLPRRARTARLRTRSRSPRLTRRPLVDKRLPVAAHRAAQRTIWPFDGEIPPDRQFVAVHDVDIAMDIGRAPAAGSDHAYRDRQPARVERCSSDGRIPHGHRASVERQELLQAFGFDIHALRGNNQPNGSLRLIDRSHARTADSLRRIVYPHTLEARDFVGQRDGRALTGRSCGPAHHGGDNDQYRSSHVVSIASDWYRQFVTAVLPLASRQKPSEYAGISLQEQTRLRS